jgi:hypothetical protein
VGSLRGRRCGRRVRIGAPDATLTPVSGMLAVTELTDYLDVIDRLDAAIGPIKQRRRGHMWVPRTVSRPLISAFAVSQPRIHSSQAAQHARSPWPFDSHTWYSPAC